MDVSKITKEEFLAVYNKHLPSKWTKFVFKYFSTNSLREDLWLRKILQGILIGLFLLGFLGAMFNLYKPYMQINTLTFTGILVLIGLTMASGAILNNIRIRKIRKELGITKAEYDMLVSLYL
jgi:hypothetical protein